VSQWLADPEEEEDDEGDEEEDEEQDEEQDVEAGTCSIGDVVPVEAVPVSELSKYNLILTQNYDFFSQFWVKLTRNYDPPPTL